MIIRRFHSLVSSLRFLATNLKHFGGFPCFSERSLPGGMTVHACMPSDVSDVMALKKELDSTAFSWANRVLLKAIPGKCCVVISDSSGALCGMSFYYFNERDVRDATIHEGFVGVRAECSGKGIATGVRRIVADHFSVYGTLCGISSRITLSNSASVASGVKAGYELLEIYKDPVSGEERGYFINRFRREDRE